MTAPPSPRSSRPGRVQSGVSANRKSIDGRRKSYGQTAKKGAVWSFVRQSGNELMVIPTSMVMARLLSPADFGVAAAATFFVLLAARLTQFGFGAALVRIKEVRPEHVASVFIVNLVMGVAAYVALVLAAPLIGGFFRSADAGALIPLAALTFLMTPFGAISSAVIQRRMQFQYIAAADWTDTAVGAIVSILFAYLGYSYWSIVYGHVVAVAVRTILLLHLSEWRPSRQFSREALGELLPYGIGLQAKRMLEYASFNLDNLVVGRMLGIVALGFYDKAFTTMNRLVTRLTLGQAPFRIFAIIHDDRGRFSRAYSRLILSITLIGFPALAGCIVVARPLFAVLYGAQWQPAVLPFQLLCLGGMLKLLNAYASQANEAAGNLWPQVRRQAVGALLIVVGAGVGSFYWGVAGAAVGVVVAMLVLTVAMQALVRRATGLTWAAMIVPLIPGLTCTALLVGVLVVVDAAFQSLVAQPPAWQELLVQALAGSAFYLVFLLFSPFTDVRELVDETIDDLLPALRRFVGRPGSGAANAQP